MNHHVTIKNFSPLLTHLHMCFKWLSEQTAIISLYLSGVINEAECVYCAVRAESLCIISSIFVLKGPVRLEFKFW